ncbi:hypothetical protein DFJ73DRAFT_961873 [Zopfochytrium polystomum]|nr:hypothetical protein DFJ73DRAFT_961873 [Zopfochytrium polystomum]
MGKSGKPSKSKKSKKKSSSLHTQKRLRVNPPKAAQAEENGGRAAVGIPEASSVEHHQLQAAPQPQEIAPKASAAAVKSAAAAPTRRIISFQTRTADSNLKKSEWTIVQSSFNKGSGQNASVKQLISKWNRITSDFDTLKKLRSSDVGSGWGWDDVKGMLVQPNKVVWEEWIKAASLACSYCLLSVTLSGKAGRNRRHFKKLKFPFYDTVDGLVGGTRATGNTHQDMKTFYLWV